MAQRRNRPTLGCVRLRPSVVAAFFASMWVYSVASDLCPVIRAASMTHRPFVNRHDVASWRRSRKRRSARKVGWELMPRPARFAAGTTEKPGRNVRAQSGLDKSVLDQGWAEFRRQLCVHDGVNRPMARCRAAAEPEPHLSKLRPCGGQQPTHASAVQAR